MKGLIFNFIVVVFGAGLTGFCVGLGRFECAVFNFILTLVNTVIFILNYKK